MNPLTPLRRSERLRRPTSKAIGSSPSSSSPGTSPYTASPVNSRSRYHSIRPGQTDSDLTLRNTTSSKSSGSSTEDTVGDASDTMEVDVDLPSKLHEAHGKLAPMLRYSDAEFMKRDVPALQDIVKKLNLFLRGVISAGYSRRWPMFNTFHKLCQRVTILMDAKRTGVHPKNMEREEVIDYSGMGNGPDFALGENWVAMKGEYWQEAWKDTADTGYLQQMYRNAAAPSVFSWEDVGAGGSEVPSKDIPDCARPVQYTMSSLDYCVFPDTH